MPSQIEARWGVPLPIDVLWRAIEERYGAEATAELQALHRRATRRYSHATELNRRRRLVAFWERTGKHGEKVERYRRSLEDPQAYIDGE